MHAVVNKLTLAKPIDDALLAKLEAFNKGLRSEPDIFDNMLVRVSDTEAVVVALFHTREGMERFSREVAGPWFAEHVRPYLGGPVSRVTGEVVASVRT
ncbi:MAG: hypothetical protein U0235_10285 [Polyangiaceae bacterium]